MAEALIEVLDWNRLETLKVPPYLLSNICFWIGFPQLSQQHTKNANDLYMW